MDLVKVQAHLQHRLQGLAAIYLFGSQAAGEANAASDFDLAVLASNRVNVLQL